MFLKGFKTKCVKREYGVKTIRGFFTSTISPSTHPLKFCAKDRSSFFSLPLHLNWFHDVLIPLMTKVKQKEIIKEEFQKFMAKWKRSSYKYMSLIVPMVVFRYIFTATYLHATASNPPTSYRHLFEHYIHKALLLWYNSN